jgi:hypothetical protein
MASSRDSDALVLSTVNAPYRRAVDGATLAACLRTGEVGSWIVHVATFFVDVRPELAIRFAGRHGVDPGRLARTYEAVRDRTGERSPAFEAALVDVADAPGSDLRRAEAAR